MRGFVCPPIYIQRPPCVTTFILSQTLTHFFEQLVYTVKVGVIKGFFNDYSQICGFHTNIIKLNMFGPWQEKKKIFHEIVGKNVL